MELQIRDRSVTQGRAVNYRRRGDSGPPGCIQGAAAIRVSLLLATYNRIFRRLRLCVLASRSALVRAAQLQPALAARFAAVEERNGHCSKADPSMAETPSPAFTY
ncbi:hypothetical protein [Streptomyces goshikiensis]